MGLADDLLEAGKPKPQKTLCPVGKVLESLDQKDKNALINAINSEMGALGIINSLKKNGYKISRDSFYPHRKRTCLCQWEQDEN